MPLAMVPDSLIATRRRLGIDHRDEMWEGVLHMNEPGNFEHQRAELELAFLLRLPAQRRRLDVFTEMGVFNPEVADWSDFRTPDILLVGADATSERGVEGRAALVVEIRSPGDESFEKIPFYGRMGVAEMLIIDRGTKEVRRWVNDGAGALTEVAAGEDGWHDLAAVGARIRGGSGVLGLSIDDQIQRV